MLGGVVYDKVLSNFFNWNIFFNIFNIWGALQLFFSIILFNI